MIFLGLHPEGKHRVLSIFEFSAFQRGILGVHFKTDLLPSSTLPSVMTIITNGALSKEQNRGTTCGLMTWPS